MLMHFEDNNVNVGDLNADICWTVSFVGGTTVVYIVVDACC